MKGFAFDLPAYVLFRIFPKKELADSLYSAPSMGSYRFFKMGYMIKFRSVFLTALLTAGLFSNSSRAGLVVSERATLQPETVMNRTGLGVTLAVDGDRMLVGALGLPVQVLARTGSDWSFTDEIPLPPPNPSSPGPGVNDSFGKALDLSGSFAVVAAPDAKYVGAVHVFTNAGGAWEHTQALESPKPSPSGGFGAAVILQDRDLFVGEPGSGNVYCYQRSGGSWSLVQTITSPAGTGSQFGAALAAEAGLLVIGAPNVNVNTWINKGKVYPYLLKNNRWVRDGALGNLHTKNRSIHEAGSTFGQAFALSQNRLAVYGSRPGGKESIQLFVRSAKGWKREQEIVGDNAAVSNFAFYWRPPVHIALQGTVLAWSSEPSSSITFAAKSGTAWDATARLPGPNSLGSYNRGGGQIAFSGSMLLAGTPNFYFRLTTPNKGEWEGAVSVVDCLTTPETRVHDGAWLHSPQLHDQDASTLGQVVLGQSGRRFFTLHNPGHAALTGIAVTVHGEGFSLANAPPAQLLPGETFSCEVLFSPSGPGPAEGNFLVESSDPELASFKIHLSAHGLTEGTPPTVAGLPPARIATAGDRVVFRVEARGAEPLNYQWLRNGKAIPGATDRVFTIAGSTLAQAGNYAVRIRNAFGRITSEVTPFAVVTPWVEERFLGEGRTFSITAKVSGPGLQLHWHKNALPMDLIPGKRLGVNETRLFIRGVNDQDSGRYTFSATLGSAHISEVGATDINVIMRRRVVPVPPLSWLVGLPVEQSIDHTESGNVLWTHHRLPPGVQFSIPKGYWSSGPVKLEGIPIKSGNYNIQLRPTSPHGSVPANIPVSVRPLGGWIGKYTGCVEPLSQHGNIGGSLDFTIASTAVISGKVLLDGKVISFRHAGVWSADPALDANAVFAGEIPLPGTAGWRLMIRVNPQTCIATGELKNSTGTLVAPLKAVRVVWPDKDNPPPGQGNYTVALAPSPSSDPLGAGYGRMTVSKKGGVRWTGKAGDGSVLTRSSALGTDFSIPLHWLLYRGLGSLQAWLQISPDGVNEVGGSAFWGKRAAAQPPRSYNQGFAKMNLQVAGARYHSPAAGTLILNLPSDPGTVTLGVDFAAAHMPKGGLDFDLSLDVRNASRVRTVDANSKRFSITVKPATGLLFGHWYEGSRRGTFAGVLLPHLGTAMGYALLPTVESPASMAPIISGFLEIAP